MLQQIEHQYAPLWAGGKTNMKLGKWLYRTFVLVQLSLAIYFSNQAIMSWYRAPIVVSGMCIHVYLSILNQQYFCNFS